MCISYWLKYRDLINLNNINTPLSILNNDPDQDDLPYAKVDSTPHLQYTIEYSFKISIKIEMFQLLENEIFPMTHKGRKWRYQFVVCRSFRTSTLSLHQAPPGNNKQTPATPFQHQPASKPAKRAKNGFAPHTKLKSTSQTPPQPSHYRLPLPFSPCRPVSFALIAKKLANQAGMLT
jgi:hypothetical protein